jgi:hypothetical protein
MPRSLSVMILVFSCVAIAAAQTPATNPPASVAPAQNPAPPETKKPKKVWTDENLSDAHGTVSVVGDPKNASKTKTASGKPADAQYIVSVRKQLEKYQEQIADIDKQLVDLKNFSSGEPSSGASGIRLNKSYDREPIEVQIRALQEKKKDLQAKSNALLDEARKRGVEPGQLR